MWVPTTMSLSVLHNIKQCESKERGVVMERWKELTGTIISKNKYYILSYPSSILLLWTSSGEQKKDDQLECLLSNQQYEYDHKTYLG